MMMMSRGPQDEHALFSLSRRPPLSAPLLIPFLRLHAALTPGKLLPHCLQRLQQRQQQQRH